MSEFYKSHEYEFLVFLAERRPPKMTGRARATALWAQPPVQGIGYSSAQLYGGRSDYQLSKGVFGCNLELFQSDVDLCFRRRQLVDN